jgi:HD superfamily phosphohydrolase
VWTVEPADAYNEACMDERARILDHLDNEYTEPVRDPVWGHIGFSRPLLKVVEHEQFQKLGRIRQLGPAALVYPGATHTRLAHSLGVFHLARRLIASLVRRSPQTNATLEGVKAFLCAALLHDIGHYPYAHSLKDLGVEAHESLASRSILGEFASTIRSDVRVEPEAVAAIIDHRIDYRGGEDVRYYWKLLSGVLDPDKLDYLNRDAYCCGVPYGIQDVDFALGEVWPHPGAGIAISRKGVTAIENILFSKYLMYKTVYWHKTVRIATAMIKKAVVIGLRDGAIRREDLYGLDDEEFFARFTPDRFPSFRLIADVRRRVLHRQVLRLPFRADLPAHRALEDGKARTALEDRIAAEASGVLGRPVPAESVVVDVPERISFEADIPVVDDPPGRPEGEARAAFADRALADLPGALRCITLSIAREEDLAAAMGSIDLARLLPTA